MDAHRDRAALLHAFDTELHAADRERRQRFADAALGRDAAEGRLVHLADGRHRQRVDEHDALRQRRALVDARGEEVEDSRSLVLAPGFSAANSSGSSPA